jgi:2-dehydro-3-deoxyphosphooctonate aldolase (KDO 8-P synthase)|tara:strand:+ start:7093 stop:7854 length:762 start_codon:yes stop_codon:yes gene_type:complete
MRIIAGPCQHETLSQSAEIAKHCRDVCEKYDFEYYFKASFDKANRTSVSGKRGVGIDSALPDLLALKETLGVKILTDVHTEGQISRCQSFVDVLQIPAFLCRQTDLIQRACKTECIVNIKKGQFLAPWDVKGVLSKTKGAKQVWITERGTSFGYNNLVVDFNGIQYMLDNLGVPIVFDATHSVQKPGGAGNSSGGNRDYVPGLARAAAALGVSNFFLEVHADPDNAPSDGPNMLRLDDFEQVINDIDRYSHTR